MAAAHLQGSAGVSPSGPVESVESVRRSLSDEAFLEDFATALDDYGFEFDGLDEVSPEAPLFSKRDGDPSLLRHVVLKGLKYSDKPQDTAISFFDNGDGILYLPDSFKQVEDTANATSLGKRYHGNAFKIAFTTRQKSLLTRAHQNDMSYELARAWQIQVGLLGANEVIRLVKTEHTANFYYRIIPELYGFGLNYESIDVCGGLAGYL